MSVARFWHAHCFFAPTAGISLCVGEEHRLLTGVNWFGFETTWGTMVDGTFNGPTALTIGGVLI